MPEQNQIKFTRNEAFDYRPGSEGPRLHHLHHLHHPTSLAHCLRRLHLTSSVEQEEQEVDPRPASSEEREELEERHLLGRSDIESTNIGMNPRTRGKKTQS